MALTSLVVCADTQAVSMLSRILADLDISVEQCGSPAMAETRLQARTFDAFLVDCQQESAAMDLIANVRRGSTNRTTLIIALVESQNDVRKIFARGANFILYKPIVAERATTSLRAARGLMRRERRKNARIALHAETSISYAGAEDVPATLLELSEEGVGIQSDRKLPPHCKVYFQFQLPGGTSPVRLSGEVVWQDATGRVGIRFAGVPQTSRRVLNHWLLENASKVPEQSVPNFAETAAGPMPGAAAGGLGLLSVSGADRRIRSRRACRLSADVHRLGSSVPVRCTLSDISTGGCYVETSAPLPAGTPVDIVVRTTEMKLRVQGKVQAMHPGFGMGVAFNLQTAEERDHVQRLIAAQTEPGLAVEF